MKSNIAQLAKKARHGDARAFGEIYSALSGEMYRYALYNLGSAEAAKDAVQDTALEAWKSIGKLKDENAAKAWFFKILSRSCKHLLREKYKADFAPLEADLPQADTNEATALGLDLLRLINALEPDEKDIVLLSVIGGLNSKEISKATAINAATVRSKLSRTLAKLRKEIEEGGNTK